VNAENTNLKKKLEKLENENKALVINNNKLIKQAEEAKAPLA